MTDTQAGLRPPGNSTSRSKEGGLPTHSSRRGVGLSYHPGQPPSAEEGSWIFAKAQSVTNFDRTPFQRPKKTCGVGGEKICRPRDVRSIRESRVRFTEQT